MIHLDIDNLVIDSEDDLETNPEVKKDKLFKNMIGHGVYPGTSKQELFLNCHRFREHYKQPAIFDISNSRGTTDSVYVPDEGKWNGKQDYAILQLKGKYAFVEVSDSEAFDLRVESFNAISQGDAVQEILRTKLKEHYVENTDDEGPLYRPPEIVDAMYCGIRKVTLYFFRRDL